jgi:hypothetical protein
MKYIIKIKDFKLNEKFNKTYENYEALYPAFSASFWNNIEVKDNIITANIYKLANEMLDSINENPDDRDKDEVKKMEQEYIQLIRGLLVGKVISFECSDCKVSKHKGVCQNILFENGILSSPDKGFFDIEYIQIKLENTDDYHNIEDDEFKIYLNEDPELYRATSKYNL